LYSKITPQILIEPFINDIRELPIDYKFWVFNGRVEFVQVDVDREHDHKRSFYDREWRKMPFSIGHPSIVEEIPEPKSLKIMIDAAELLSENISFVRVDFYEVSGKPLFGEMTFYPASGIKQFDPPEYDKIIGNMWK